MQVIMSMIFRRTAKSLKAKRATILDPWFVDLLTTHHQDFMMSEEKDKYLWGALMKAYVTGKSTGKWMKSEFLNDVDVVYVPMNWGSCHWVGLVINLKLRTIQILDSFADTTPDEAVAFLIAPVTECLPWLLKRYIPSELTNTLPTTPFTWERLRGLYNNNGDGDCGPVSAKFLELHAHGFSIDRHGAVDRRCCCSL